MRSQPNTSRREETQILPQQTLVRSADLCRLLGGINRCTLSAWVRKQPDLAACRFRRGWWYVGKLRAIGLLCLALAVSGCGRAEPVESMPARVGVVA